MNVHSVNARRGRGRPRVDDKRRRIMDAALKTFAAFGYHGTTVPEVAKAARVGTGTVYIYFATKEHLVNEVFRDAKKRLQAALIGELPTGKEYRLDLAERWFTDLWMRLGAFARAEPEAFRFLEMQDHAPYLDGESKQLELSVLVPLWIAGNRMHDRLAGVRVEVLIALMWGAFVGLVKAGRLGYLDVSDRTLRDAGQTVWKMVAPRAWRATEPKPKKG